MEPTKTRLTRWLYAERWPLLAALLAAAAVPYPLYAYQLRTRDSLHVGSLYIADLWAFNPYWETEQGRWGLRLVDMLRGGIDLPALSALLMLLFYTLAGLAVVRLFALRSRAARFLIPLLVVCSPYVAEVETFHYCSAAYGLSFLLAVLAVFAAVYAPPLWWAGGALCLMFSLSMYQASLGVAAGLCVMALLLAVLQQRAWLPMLRRMLVMGVSGSAAYYIVLKLFLKWYGTSLFGSYANGPVEILKALPQGLANAYRDFAVYFTQQYTIAQNYYGQRLAYACVLAVTLAVAALWLVKLRQKRTALLAVALLLLLPAAINITDILNADSHIELRMAGALVLVAPFCLALLEQCPIQGKKLAVWPLAAGAVCGVLLLRGYIVQVNNDAMVMLAQKNKIVHLADRICVQLEQNADYQAGAEVCILGEPQKGLYAAVSPLHEKASDLAQFGLLSYDPTFNARGWHSLYWEELGIELNWCSDETTRALCASEAFQAMPAYPQQGSIQTLDGVVVVKVADIQ